MQWACFGMIDMETSQDLFVYLGTMLKKRWVQLGHQNIEDGAEVDYFGKSVAISSNGMTLAAGVVENGTGRLWEQVGEDTDGKVARD